MALEQDSAALVTMKLPEFVLRIFRFSFSFLSQRIKVVPFLVQQTFFYQLLYRIENRRALVRIIASGFEKLMQVERFLAPVIKTGEHAFFDFVHGKDNSGKRCRTKGGFVSSG